MKKRKLIPLFTVLCCAALPALANGAPQGAPPPTEYKSDATKAWGEAEATDAGVPEAPAAQPEADTEHAALRQKCDAAIKKGESLPECKALELDIVFQGGMGSKQAPAAALPQERDAESSKLVEKKLAIEEQEAEQVAEKEMDLWAVARRERPLLEAAPSGFLAVGVRVGYPFLVARGSGLEQGYRPIIHASIEGAYQALRFLQIALVVDFQALRGDSAVGEEYLPLDVQYESGTEGVEGDPRPLRDIGSLLDDFYGVGVRPTVRLGGEWRSFQASLGLGFGWHFMHASGRWRAKLGASDRAVDNDLYGDANWKGTDFAVYSFEENDNGAYTVFELTLGYRFLDGHLGAGVMFEYSVLLHGRTSPEVTNETPYGVESDPSTPASWLGYTAETDDYEETLVRHLGAMNFLTIGAVADYRF
ncbi:MAG: hypothetical protein M0R80_15900 [Proteobacteria bacterium]|jgi:hypothetical protein|nr:hypothetical protein [Pseudomonadota bacterium]